MLSKKKEMVVGSSRRETMVYDPTRLPPEKPPTLFQARRESGWARENPVCRCPVCEGTGRYMEEVDSEHEVKCEICNGIGTISEGQLEKLYFDKYREYRIAMVDWKRYNDTLTRIKRKLDNFEKVFLNLTIPSTSNKVVRGFWR